MCKTKFASKAGAMNHIQKVCGTKGTEAERDLKIAQILFERQVSSGQIGPLDASFLRSTGKFQ